MGGIILTSPGYLELLRSNKTFARLWGSNMILYIGDWFTVLAMFLLAGDATDNSPLAIAGVLAVRSFTFAPLEPITGMLADRYPRKYLMIIANLFSFVILISFILTGILDNLFSVYALTILLVVGRAIYDPAGTAYLPTICNEEELLTANALISGGWSASMGNWGWTCWICYFRIWLGNRTNS